MFHRLAGAESAVSITNVTTVSGGLRRDKNPHLIRLRNEV